jgi:Uma2 family endonuclease
MRPETEAEKATLIAYFNSRINEDQEMPESVPQFNLILFLASLLRWHFRTQDWFIVGNLAILQENYNPVGPDLAVFKNVTNSNNELNQLRSWRLGQPNRPAPAVTFEIASEGTWFDDLEIKPDRYATLGVREYFAYDPQQSRLWPNQPSRILGWRYDTQGIIQSIPLDVRGWLWSEQLELWLAPDGEYLRFYTSQGQRVLDQAETEQITMQALLAKLHSHGIDPDKL